MKAYPTIAIFAPSGTHLKSALRCADRLVARGGTIWLFDVLRDLTTLERAVIPERLQELYTREREQELQDAVRQVDMTNRVRIDVMTGNPLVSIVSAVVERHVELLLKPARIVADGQTLDALDMKLLRKCPCQVWMVPQGTPRPVHTLLAAINPFGDDPTGDALNRSILDAAMAVAAADEAVVHVVTAWSLYGEDLLRRRLPAEEVDGYVNESRRQVEEAFRRELGPYAETIPERHRHLVRGDASEVIVRLVDEVGADLIVIGTIARSGIPGLLIGNTAETILRRVRCQVLAVKPADFVSPVASVAPADAVML